MASEGLEDMLDELLAVTVALGERVSENPEETLPAVNRLVEERGRLIQRLSQEDWKGLSRSAKHRCRLLLSKALRINAEAMAAMRQSKDSLHRRLVEIRKGRGALEGYSSLQTMQKEDAALVFRRKG